MPAPQLQSEIINLEQYEALPEVYDRQISELMNN